MEKQIEKQKRNKTRNKKPMGKEKIPAIADVGVNLMFLRDRDELMLVLSLQRGKGDRDIYERLERLRRAKARKNGGKRPGRSAAPLALR